MFPWSEFPFVDMSFILFRHFLNKSVSPKRPLVYVYTYNIDTVTRMISKTLIDVQLVFSSRK